MPIPHVRRIPCIRYCGCSEEKHQTRFSWLGYLFPWFEQSCLGTMSNLIFLYQLPHCYSTNVAWNHASLDLWSESVEQPEMNKASISSTRLTLRSVVLRIFLGGKGLLRTTRACVLQADISRLGLRRSQHHEHNIWSTSRRQTPEKWYAFCNHVWWQTSSLTQSVRARCPRGR